MTTPIDDFIEKEAKSVTQETLDATLQEVADLEAQLKALKKKKGIKVKEEKPKITSVSQLNIEDFLANGNKTTDLDSRVQKSLYAHAQWSELELQIK